METDQTNSLLYTHLFSSNSNFSKKIKTLVQKFSIFLKILMRGQRAFCQISDSLQTWFSSRFCQRSHTDLPLHILRSFLLRCHGSIKQGPEIHTLPNSSHRKELQTSRRHDLGNFMGWQEIHRQKDYVRVTDSDRRCDVHVQPR